MRKIRGINLAIIILSGMLISVFIFGYIQVNDNKIAKNTYIKNVDIGKLSKEEAKEKIKNECKFETITFTYKDKEWNVEPRDIDTKYDIDQTIENALNVNRNKNILYNSIDMIKSNLGIENNVNIVVDCNEEKVKEKLKEISKEINIDMENATIDISDGNIKINKEKAGIQLDLKATLINLKKSLQNGIYKENLVVTKVEPKVTKEDLKNVNVLLGNYKTVLSDVNPGRVENIKIATERTSGILLMPGEEFSYNNHTGMRTEVNGYKNATVISAGEAVQGLGGGVCQVSTTLYNAVLYAGLDIVKVSNHSIPSSYVQKGRDAVVSDSGLDFVFKNNYNGPVYIRNYYNNGTVTCQIYGNISDKKDIEIVTATDNIGDAPVKKENDSTLESGKEKVIQVWRSSYTVSTYRVYYDKNGKEYKREKVATSYYPSKQKIIAVGTKKGVIEVKKDDNSSQIDKDSNSKNNISDKSDKEENNSSENPIENNTEDSDSSDEETILEN